MTNIDNFKGNLSNCTVARRKLSRESSGKKVGRSSVGQCSLIHLKYLQEMNVNSMSPGSFEAANSRFCCQATSKRPLFQLSIQIPNHSDPEIIQYYEGQDPYHVALSLHYKYP